MLYHPNQTQETKNENQDTMSNGNSQPPLPQPQPYPPPPSQPQSYPPPPSQPQSYSPPYQPFDFPDQPAFTPPVPQTQPQPVPLPIFQYEIPQFPMRRPRDCDETVDNSLAKRPHIQPILPTPPPPLPPPPPPQHNNGHYNNGRVNKLFYKTRLCQKFSAGNCPYGNSCNFAHGSNDLRVPPSNWKDIITHPDNISKNLSEKPGVLPKGLCHRYIQGLGCPKGERCIFAHPNPLPSFPVRPNESLVVAVNKDSRESESNSEKKGPCFKWETTGYCLYGDRCQFFHFPRDPTKFRSRYAKADHGHPHAAVAPLKSPQSVPSNASPPSTAAANPFCKMKAEEKKLFLINKGHNKINGVYGDWIEDDSPS